MTVRSTPEQDAALRARLKTAVDQFAAGSADLFGRQVGYANGGYVRELLSGNKPVRTAMIERVHQTPGMEGWFDQCMSTVTRADLGAPAHPLSGGGGEPGVAQLMSFEAVKVPSWITWGVLMGLKELPAEFTVRMPDGALADRVPEGTAMIFKRADTAKPRQCVLVEDRARHRYIRRYVQSGGSNWQAQALDDAYVSLHSERDGLRILAVMAWREGGEI